MCRVDVCYSVLQCGAVWCNVVQCVAVSCSLLQCVAVCSGVLQCIAVCCIALHVQQASTPTHAHTHMTPVVNVCYNVLRGRVVQCGAACCSVLQCVAVHAH